MTKIYNPRKLTSTPSFNISKETKSQNFKLKCVYGLDTIIALLNLSRQVSNLIEHGKQEEYKKNTSGNVPVSSLKLERLWKFLFPRHSDSYVFIIFKFCLAGGQQASSRKMNPVKPFYSQEPSHNHIVL